MYMKRIVWFQKLTFWACEMYFRVIYNLKFTGLENVPKGGCIVCANHTSLADPMLAAIVGAKKNSKVAAMAKKELFEKFALRNLLISIGGFPVDRSKADVTAIKIAYKALEDEEKFIIFPEGTRVKEGEIADVKAGAGMFALRTKKPVLPIYISPVKKFRSKVDVIVGKPFYPEAGDRKKSEAYMYASEQIIKEIYDLGK